MTKEWMTMEGGFKNEEDAKELRLVCVIDNGKDFLVSTNYVTERFKLAALVALDKVGFASNKTGTSFHVSLNAIIDEELGYTEVMKKFREKLKAVMVK